MNNLLNLLAAIALLVWGTHLVRTGILRVFGTSLRNFLAHSLSNRFSAMAAGVGVTALVQSVWLSFARQGVPADALNGAWAPHVAGSNLAYTLRCQATPETGLLAPVRQTWLADAALPA